MVSFYNNFGLIFRSSKNKPTKGIENWSLSTTPLLIGTTSRENRSEYPHKPYTARHYSLGQTFLLLTVWEYPHSFHTVGSKSEAEKTSQIDDENRFWHQNASEGSDYPTVVWGPRPHGTPMNNRISTWTLYHLKVESLGFVSAADSMHPSSFKFSGELQKTHHLCTRGHTAIQGHQGRWYW